MVTLEREAWRELAAARAIAAAASSSSTSTPPDTSLEGELRQIEGQLTAAQADGSHVAAEKLLARRSEIVEAIRARDDARRKAERTGQTPTELIGVLAATILRMPESARQALRDRLGW